MHDSAETKTFDVVYELSAVASGVMRNDVRGRMLEPVLDHIFEMATDEGGYHGGDGSAPPPLAYFTTGLVTCLMTQLRASAKRLRITIGLPKIDARIEWKGDQVGNLPYVARGHEFRLDIDLQCETPLAEQKRVLEAATKSCVVEAILTVPIRHRLRIGDKWVEA